MAYSTDREKEARKVTHANTDPVWPTQNAINRCTGLAGSHQYGIAKIKGGCIRHPFKWRLQIARRVITWVGNSKTVLPRQACGKVDHIMRLVCHNNF